MGPQLLIVAALSAALAVTPAAHPPRGLVRVEDHCLLDGSGPFLGLGASYFTALWRCRNNRPRLEADLATLARSGVRYTRILSMVGWHPSWEGLEIAPVAYTSRTGKRVEAWPDYWQRLAELVDLTYDRYGMRTQVTIFADAQMMPERAARLEHMRRMLADVVAGRERKVILLEVANEAWQNGFPGDQGIADLREFTRYLADRTEVPVATTSNHEADFDALYRGGAADIATWHFSRDRRAAEGWQPVIDCWDLGLRAGCPPVSSNEPVGPGSSVASEPDEMKLLMAPAFAFAARLPMYVYHSEAGVVGRSRFEDSPGLAGLAGILRLLPGDLPNWQRFDSHDAGSPLTAVGCVRLVWSIKGRRIVGVAVGVNSPAFRLEARETAGIRIVHPGTGRTLGAARLRPGEAVTLPGAPSGVIILGELGPRQRR
jgi:hypothetical protein